MGKLHCFLFNRNHYIYLRLSPRTELGEMAKKVRKWVDRKQGGGAYNASQCCQILTTEETFEANLVALRESDIWLANPKLRNWFEKTWLVEAKVRKLRTYNKDLHHGLIVSAFSIYCNKRMAHITCCICVSSIN